MRARDHHPVRTLAAIVGTLPASMLTGAVAARWMPLPEGWAFALGWHLPYLVWPAAIVGVLCLRSWREAVFAVGAATAVLGVAAAW